MRRFRFDRFMSCVRRSRQIAFYLHIILFVRKNHLVIFRKEYILGFLRVVKTVVSFKVVLTKTFCIFTNKQLGREQNVTVENTDETETVLTSAILTSRNVKTNSRKKMRRRLYNHFKVAPN